MPGRHLPTFSRSAIATHNTTTSCYVTIGNKVYDVTSFLPDHPGGGDLIAEYGGQDVAEIMQDEISHAHSEAAYEVLDECLVGFAEETEPVDELKKAKLKVENDMNATTAVSTVEIISTSTPDSSSRISTATAVSSTLSRPLYESTGMSSAEDLSRETDAANDFQTHKFLDLNRPLIPQVWNGGFSKDFYLEQVHRPRHYRGGDSAPLFGNFLEPLTKTAWWIVPSVWLPPVAYGTWLAGRELGILPLILYWIVGLCFWTIVEYGLHRLLFHIDNNLPDNRIGITAHFLLHGVHHYLPMDRYRLVMPPTLFLVLATPFWHLAHLVFFYNWYAAVAVYCGGIFGYICYDLTHYFLHHKNLPSYYRELKKYHLKHHFADYQNGFGVTSRFWDRVFKTELEMPGSKVVKAS